MLRRCRYRTLFLLIAATACNPPEENKSSVKIDISTWWIKGGEKDALSKLEAINHEHYPNVTLLVNRGADEDEAFTTLESRFYQKNPPDTFQANGGSRLLSRVVRGAKGSTTDADNIPQLTSVKSIYERADASIWQDVDTLVKVNREPYGVPLNVHRINNLYFSIEKLKSFRKLKHLSSYDDLRLPKNLDEFLSLSTELTLERGGGAVGIGIYTPWTLEALVFENLLPSVALNDKSLGDEMTRKQFFELFWMGRKPPSETPNFNVIENTLLYAQRLWPNVTTFGNSGNSDGSGDWTSPFDALCGKSPVTFVVMGDWATGYLRAEGFSEGVDYGVVPFPGTEALYILTTDALPLTAYAKHPNETKDFLTTALSEKAQLAFSTLKGSVPAIQLDELPKESFGRYQRDLLTQLKNDEVYKSPALSGLLTPNLPTITIRDGLDAMLAPADGIELEVDQTLLLSQRRSIVHNILNNNYWLFQEWSNRLAGYH
jgi:glucose/mannose transport system substrate-binding protein